MERKRNFHFISFQVFISLTSLKTSSNAADTTICAKLGRLETLLTSQVSLFFFVCLFLLLSAFTTLETNLFREISRKCTK